MEKKRTGRWGAMFEGRSSFHDEADRSVEIGAKWIVQPGQVDIVLDEIPGWLPPMWGSDHEWLYLRRPEGVWKTRLPSKLKGDSINLLHQQRSNGDPTHSTYGGMVMGHSILNQPGWVRGRDVENPMDAAERDERALPSNRGFDLDADAVGNAWGKLVSSEPARLVVDAGDFFCSEPSFAIQGDWLLATDPMSGYRVGFPLTSPALRTRIEAGELWLFFSNRWFRGIEVHVRLAD